MSTTLSNLRRPPEARTERIEDLVFEARRGRIRVPHFQRGLRWRAPQVLDLLDSIHRGFPIGSLLLHKRMAPAASVFLGTVEIDAPEMPDAWWVVDGQQRLSSLTASLARTLPLPTTPDDIFVVYFDPQHGKFVAPLSKGDLPDHWVPLPLLLDAAQLSLWMLEWSHKENRDWARVIFEAGKRIREYRIPLYIADTDDPEVLREIFFRTNKSGQPLEWDEVFNALYGQEGPTLSTTHQLSKALTELGMGKLTKDQITHCLLASRGLNVTQTLAEHHRRNPTILKGSVPEALPALRQVLSFLRVHAGVPHLKLLPRDRVLEALTRFFVCHPQPSSRTLELLTRWVWRAMLSEGYLDKSTLKRRGVAAISSDEEQSIQDLLKLVPREIKEIEVPSIFDPRSAETRIAMVALASLKPRNLVTGQPVATADLIEEQESADFRHIIAMGSKMPQLGKSASNRILLAGKGNARRDVVAAIQQPNLFSQVLGSHAISNEAAMALVEGQDGDFLRIRQETIQLVIRKFLDRHAGWSRGDRDRPSISYLEKKEEQ